MQTKRTTRRVNGGQVNQTQNPTNPQQANPPQNQNPANLTTQNPTTQQTTTTQNPQSELPYGIYHVMLITDTKYTVEKMYISSDYFLPYISSYGNPLTPSLTSKKCLIGMVDIRPEAIDKSPMKFAEVDSSITEFNMPIPFESLPTEFP